MGLPNIGPGELILILIIALVVLGPGKLPDVASSLGRSVREFRRAATDVSDAGKLDASSSADASSATTSQHAPAAPAVPPPPPPDTTTPGPPAGTSIGPARDSNPS
jgi:sec-independent protein translocase protein TatA